jgi:hypothetical protein
MKIVTPFLGLLLVLLVVNPFGGIGTPAALGQPASADAPSATPVTNPDALGPSIVVPEKQEELLAQMFAKGETLPGDCRFAGGQAQGSQISATYRCAGGEVVFELHHPSDAASAVARTERFGILVGSGSPPPGLVDALAARIRSRESAFEWKIIGSPAQSTSNLGPLAAVGLLGLAALAWVLWRKMSARQSRTA